MKEGVLGFIAALAVLAVIFGAVWKYLDRMEKSLGHSHAR